MPVRRAASLRTWIAANKESPQRKAFVEAAREWMRSISQDGLYSQAKIAACETAYRAMIEAEKVEGVK